MLFKAGDRANPDHYRGICVSSVLGKLFGLVIRARLSHWAQVNNMISPSQIGFSTYLGCEYHIFTVIEMIKHHVRNRRHTFALFVDFKKAYDCVHLGSVGHL
jgi:hypothetical protein